jgi:methylglutaconyl-CoA hydratase
VGTKVTLSVEGGVCSIWIDRPEVHNAFDEEVISELTRAFGCAFGEPNARVIVLGARGKSFSAGADLAWMRRAAAYDEKKNLDDARALAHMLRTIDESPLVTIARVNGAALGGGAGLVAACDFAVARKEAVFGFSEVKLGIVPAVISPHVIGKIGAARARRLFVTGERFDAKMAEEYGLVSSVVGSEKALDRAVREIVDMVLTSGPKAVAAAKDLVRVVSRELDDPARVDELTARRIAERRASDEGREGIAAFLEKRKPAWHPEARLEAKKA